MCAFFTRPICSVAMILSILLLISVCFSYYQKTKAKITQ